MMSSDPDMSSLIAKYRAVVEQYEQIDEDIDGLIMRYEGKSELMPPEDLERYRTLARRRDEIFNEMRSLEQQLLIDDDETEK
jgi:hypothetical protein